MFRNIYVKNNRLVLGEVGLSAQIIDFNEDNEQNLLYYPLEYFEENFNEFKINFDIWSLGCVLFEILNDSKLFKDKNQVKNKNLPEFHQENELIKYLLNE